MESIGSADLDPNRQKKVKQLCIEDLDVLCRSLVLFHEGLKETLVLALKFFFTCLSSQTWVWFRIRFYQKAWIWIRSTGYRTRSTVQYAYSCRLYKEKSIQCKTRDLAIADLNKYYIALDATIMKFHQEKMLVSGSGCYTVCVLLLLITI